MRCSAEANSNIGIDTANVRLYYYDLGLIVFWNLLCV